MLRNNLTFFCLECMGSSGFLPSRKLTVFESEYLVENYAQEVPNYKIFA